MEFSSCIYKIELNKDVLSLIATVEILLSNFSLQFESSLEVIFGAFIHLSTLEKGTNLGRARSLLFALRGG